MRRRVAWPGAVALVLAIAGCSKNETPPAPAKGDGTVKSIATVATGGTSFRLPFDAALSPDGKTVYFTALVDDEAALFSVPAAGGTPTKLADLVAPGSVDVTGDGQTVLVADPGVESSTGALGAVVAVSSSGGMPAAIPGTEGTAPRGVAASGNRIVFTGTDPADGAPAVNVIRSYANEKKVLSLMIGPSTEPPNWLRTYLVLSKPARLEKKSFALSRSLRLYS